MKNTILKVAIALVFINLTSCSEKNYIHRQVPDYCKDIINELNYRIISVNDSVYTFRFKYPPVDTFQESINTKRMQDYKNFAKYMNKLSKDSLRECDIKENDVIRFIGEPSHVTILKKYKNLTKEGKVLNYLFDFGLNCDPSLRYLESAGNCDRVRFKLDSIGVLYNIYFHATGWGVEYKLEKIYDDIRKGIREKYE